MTLKHSGRGWDIDLREAIVQEDALAALLLNHGGRVEVKADKMAEQTGNFFIEVRQKMRPSGLVTTEAEWWALRYGDHTWVLTHTDRLRQLTKRAAQLWKIKEGGDFNHYDGVVVPAKWFVEP
ncbi:MAG TPA: hypothetical protein VNM48_01345 [Chloroflexota bacterium]|nr:hypothetical protein [Chloroflexota bacterium]